LFALAVPPGVLDRCCGWGAAAGCDVLASCCSLPLSAGRLKLRAELTPGKLLDGCIPDSAACFLTHAFQACTTLLAAAATCSLLLLDSLLMRLPASVSLSRGAVTCEPARTLRMSTARVSEAASPSSTALAAASLALPTSFVSSWAGMVAVIVFMRR
jgi:hypothetical protein